MAKTCSRSGSRRWADTARLLGLSLLLLVAPAAALAASVSLAWDPVASGALAGYMLHYGPTAGSYSSKIDVGKTTTYTVTGLTSGATYHFVVTAYDASHLESGFSNDVGATATPDVGLYRKAAGVTKPAYRYILDYNADRTTDAQIQYGAAGDIPLVGFISPGGKSSFIAYRNGMWNIDTNRDGTTDAVYGLGGLPGDIPLTANFSGPGALDDLVIYRAGVWYVDTDLNGTPNQTYVFGGVPGDIPLAGDVNGDGMADLAIYRGGMWYIDTNRNGTADMTVGFGGLPQDVPLLFDWNGDGKADLCIFRDGVWYISTKRDGVADVTFSYGTAGDLPMLGVFH